MKHAIVKIGDYEIPLIGIPENATLAACDGCHGIFYLTDVELNAAGNQFLCAKCSRASIAAELLGACRAILDETNAGTWDCLPVVLARAAIAKAEAQQKEGA